MLDLEPLIRQRLEAKAPSLAGVHSVLSLAPEDVAGKRLPAAFVASNGHRVLEVTEFGKTARLASRWMVVVAVRNVKNIMTGEEARADAATPINECMSAIMGWNPRPGVQTMMPTTPPDPVYENGLLLYPITFECGEVVQAI